jgi:Uncharacterized conserved protein
MDYPRLEKKRDFLRNNISVLSMELREKYDRDFAIRYTYNSTAIEGNTLTLMETKLLLEDKQAVGGKSMREIYESTNHDKAFSFAKRCITESKSLNENLVKDIHELLMENIQQGGIYRNVDVRISGAEHEPPSSNEMYIQVKNFYMDLPSRTDLNPVELAAWTHAEFVRIHPFEDGNGRTSRLIMNYQLMANGFLPVDIPVTKRSDYYTALEEYAVHGNLAPFAEMVAELEGPAMDYYIRAIEMTQAQSPGEPELQQ